jgi:hypothetical protein
MLSALLLARAAAITSTRQSGAATVVLAHATQKILATDPAPAAGRALLHLTAARNEYEPLLVVLSGAQTVDAVACTVLAGGEALPTAVYRVGYVSVVNITDCQSLGPGELPDPLIPDVDSFVHEKRNAFPLTVRAKLSLSALSVSHSESAFYDTFSGLFMGAQGA